MTKRATAVLVCFLLAGACVGQQPSPPARLTVVTTTTVVADFVRQVGGERVDVHALVPKGGEVHTFDPAPSDAARLSGAGLLVMNGLGLDEWLLALVEESGADVPVLELAEDLADVEYLASAEEHAGESGAEHPFNPHVWMNAGYARLYVDRIRLKLIEIDPAGQAAYDAGADAYETRLSALDEWIRQQFDAIPAASRRVVSFHDAFPYFAAAYDLEIVGVLVDAPGQEPSAAEVAQLIEAIRQADVKALLAEVQFSDRLVQAIAAEAGASVVSDLYTDTLGDPPVDGYEGAMRWNVERIVAALR